MSRADEAQIRAVMATRRSAAAHTAAARRHEQLASTETDQGDAEEHRRRALEHHAMADADLRAASQLWPPEQPLALSPGPGTEEPGTRAQTDV